MVDPTLAIQHTASEWDLHGDEVVSVEDAALLAMYDAIEVGALAADDIDMAGEEEDTMDAEVVEADLGGYSGATLPPCCAQCTGAACGGPLVKLAPAGT